jgi:hypothetical protein
MKPVWIKWVALLTGIGVLVISGIFISMQLRTVEPLNGAYGDQAMLAFELTDTPSGLARVIGGNPPSAEAVAIRQAMDHANRVDFLYMAFYATFIGFSCASLALSRGRGWLWLGLILGPVAAGFDVLENLALMALTRPDAEVAPLLAALHVRTYCKWELLALASALFAAGFVGGGRLWVSVVAALVALLALACGVLAYLDPARFIAPLAYAIAAVWLWQLGYAVVGIRKA